MTVTTPLDQTTLFRLTVISPLLSSHLKRGELKTQLRDLAKKAYIGVGGIEVQLSEKTLESWYYAYRKGHLAGLTPKIRQDKGRSKRLTAKMETAILAAKKENPKRSAKQILQLLQMQGVLDPSITRICVYRCLKAHKLSKIAVPAVQPKEELRAYEAEHGGDVWYCDVLHANRIISDNQLRKTYLIAIIDDATRFVCHAGFYFDEGALSVEHAFKQAILKRGLCRKFVVDNGSGFKTHSLREICALLGVHLVRCKAYHPQGKAKLERWNRTVRAQLLSEINWDEVTSLSMLNQYLWAWLNECYHESVHAGLPPKTTPRQRWHEELVHVRPLGHLSQKLDEIFYHCFERVVKKDGTVSFKGRLLEVPYEWVGQKIRLVVDPHQDERVLFGESLARDESFAVNLLDKKANTTRKRAAIKPAPILSKVTRHLADVALERYRNQLLSKGVKL